MVNHNTNARSEIRYLSARGGLHIMTDFYKEKIIEMVKETKRCDILIYIYKLVSDIVKEDDNNE